MLKVLFTAGLLAMSVTAAQSAAPLEKHLNDGVFTYSTALDSRAQLHRDLWEVVRAWAGDVHTPVSDCVVQLRVEEETLAFRSWHIECDRPFDSPFFGSASSKPVAATFSSNDLLAFGRTLRLRSADSTTPPGEYPGNSAPLAELLSAGSRTPPGRNAVWTDCWINVAFTEGGIAAENMECSVQGNEFVNTEIATADGAGRWTVSTGLHRLCAEQEHRKTAGKTINETWKAACPGEATTSDWFVLEIQEAERARRAEAARIVDPHRIPFTITGEIHDRDEHSLAVWGKAIPPGGSNPLGALYRDSNIVVLYPDQSRLMGPMYAGGSHCFVGKRSGTNAFGATVPGWVYGPCPLPAGSSWVFVSKNASKETVLNGPYKTYPSCYRAMEQSSAPGLSGRCYAASDDVIRKQKTRSSPK